MGTAPSRRTEHLFAEIHAELVNLNRKIENMPIIAAYQPLIDAINANTTAIQALKAAGATLPAGAADAQDVTDTESALQAAIDAQNTALSAS